MTASLALLAGCPVCPDGEMAGAPSDSIVRAGDVLDLHAIYGDYWDAGPDHCTGFWYVNGIEGGSTEVGTIDHCGHYQAPPAFVAGLEIVRIEATEWDLINNGCADCCPYALLQLEPAKK